MGKAWKEVDGVMKIRNPKNKKNKTAISFDEQARNEWLTGFSRRKNERRKRAQHEEIERLKEEKRQLKKKKREERASELEKMREAVGATFTTELDSVAEPKVYDLPSHTVTMVDVLDPNFSGRAGLRLGINNDDGNDEYDARNTPRVDEEGTSKDDNPPAKGEKLVKKTKKRGKVHKNRSHLMDKHKKKKKTQIPNKWTRIRRKK